MSLIVADAVTDDDTPGAWFVYDRDWNAYPIALFDSELEALRWAARSGYGKVVFWPFGTEWSDVKR